MITPEQLRVWAQDADDGEDVALDGETLREIAERTTPPKMQSPLYCKRYHIASEQASAWATGWNDCVEAMKRRS